MSAPPAHAWRRAAAAMTLGLLGLSACGDSVDRPPPEWHEVVLRIPHILAGYVVQPEPNAASALRTGGERSLLRGGAVYSLREATEVKAVLEVGELRAGTNGEDPGFQQDVVGQIGQSIPRPVRVRGHTVYEGRGANQESVFGWFTATRMMVLLTHGIRQPQPLLEAALAVPT